MNAISIFGELRRAGISIRLDGETLRLKPASGGNLPPDLVERVRTAKPDLVAYLAASPAAPVDIDRLEERVAIMTVDGGLPEDIARGIAMLDTMPVPHGFAPIRWQSIVNAAAKFSDRWGSKALKLGWSPPELWGLHPEAPAARLDTRGLAFMLSDADVVAMDDRQAVLRLHRGGEQRYRRWKANDGAVLAWAMQRARESAA